MPSGENFWNPYRMVPIRTTITRKPPITHDKIIERSGIIECTLTNLTPFLIGDRNDFRQFVKRNGQMIIPGSTLKGSIRSLAEIIGGGCAASLSDLSCSNNSDLCITCRMFGMMEREKRSHAKVHLGQVLFGDALIQEKITTTKDFNILRTDMTPKPRHRAFYRNPHTNMVDNSCRKFYFHQPHKIDSILTSHHPSNTPVAQIRALLPDHHFSFSVQFTNLNDEELSLLLYTLNLEDEVEVVIQDTQDRLKGPMRHKIGYGKPLGMGSCAITITKITYIPDPSVRYAFLHTQNRTFINNALHQEIHSRIKAYVDDHSLTMQQLRKMMVWDVNDNREFRYPSYVWFNEMGNHDIPLKLI